MSTTPCIRRLKPCYRAYHPRTAVRPQAPAVPQDDALSFCNACFEHILHQRRCRVCAVRRRIPHHRRLHDVLRRTSRLRARVPHEPSRVPLNLRRCKLSPRLVDVAPTGRAHTLCHPHLTLFAVHLLCLMPFSCLSPMLITCMQFHRACAMIDSMSTNSSPMFIPSLYRMDFRREPLT